MEPKLRTEYKISKEEWLKGYDIYASMFKKKSAYLRAAIFVVPLALFIEQIIRDSSYTMGWICIVICVAMITAALLTPIIERKQTAQALDAIADDTYVLELYDDRFTVSTKICEDEKNLEYDENGEVRPLPEIPASVCELSEKSLRGCETADIIALFSNKGSFFIPKSALDSESLETFKTSLISALDKRYKVKN